MSTKAAPQRESDAVIQRLLAAEDVAASRALVQQRPELDWQHIVTTLTDRVRQEVHVNTAQAQRLADVAIVVAETTKNALALGKSFRAKANALYAQDQHVEAVEMHARAISLFDEPCDHLGCIDRADHTLIDHGIYPVRAGFGQHCSQHRRGVQNDHSSPQSARRSARNSSTTLSPGFFNLAI